MKYIDFCVSPGEWVPEGGAAGEGKEVAVCTLVLLAWKGYTLLTFACRPNQFDGIEATFVLFCDFACCHVIKISDPRRNAKGGTPLYPFLCPTPANDYADRLFRSLPAAPGRSRTTTVC